MKRYLPLLLFLLIVCSIGAEDFYYTVKKKTVPTIHLYEQSPLFPGDKIKPTFRAIVRSGIFQIRYYKEYPNVIAQVDVDALFIEGSANFDDMILCEKDENGFTSLYYGWMPIYYLKALSEKEINSITEYEPNIDVNHFINTMFWFSDVGIFLHSAGVPSYSTLYLKKIEQFNNNYYKILMTPNISTDGEDSRLKDFTNNEEYILYIHHNQNRLRIYVDGEDTPRWELMKVEEEFTKLFRQFPKSGWTGEQDYTSYLAADIFEPWETLPLTEIKKQIEDAEKEELSALERPASPTHQVSENLRLRSAPGTSTEIVTTLGAGTNVYQLSEGLIQTIGNITAPWVYVETEDGTRGWCFSGYLEEIKNEVSAVIPVGENDEPQSTQPETIEVSESGNSIPIIPLAVGGGIAIAAAGIILALRKKK